MNGIILAKMFFTWKNINISIFMPHLKMYFKWVKFLNIKNQTTAVLKETLSECFIILKKLY